MIDGLKPCAEYKDSGVPWLGDIPSNWDVRRMKLLLHELDSRSSTGKEQLLRVSQYTGVTQRKSSDGSDTPDTRAASLVGYKRVAEVTKYKLVRRSDLAYNTMRMWQGAVGVVPCDGLVSPAYVVLTPRAEACSEFYNHVFRTEVYKQQVNRHSTGIVSDRNRLYWDSFKQMPNILLPKPEQDQIVAFIENETVTINAALTRTEREISLLREYRTRLIADVVTGKLDVRPVARDLPVESMGFEQNIMETTNAEALEE